MRSTVVVISAYASVPGALHISGDPGALPDVISPQLTAYHWLPEHIKASAAIMVDFPPSDVEWMCTLPKLIACLGPAK